jgi:hypothetical protein
MKKPSQNTSPPKPQPAEVPDEKGVGAAATCSPRFHGKLDPNAVLRGETQVVTGDTFIQESIDMCGFAAMRYTPKSPEPPKAYMHFEVLATGTWDTCHTAANNSTMAST